MQEQEIRQNNESKLSKIANAIALGGLGITMFGMFIGTAGFLYRGFANNPEALTDGLKLGAYSLGTGGVMEFTAAGCLIYNIINHENHTH